MRVLVLGGTAWVGGMLAAEAVRRGHEVVCLARGSAPVPKGSSLVEADRDRRDAYDAVRAQRWDAVVDVARHPGHVRGAAAALAEAADHSVFVSSGNVYADHLTPHLDEEAPLLPALEADRMPDMSRYGEAKVACEEAVARTFDGRTLISRSGLIGGRGDLFGRSGYWPWRLAHPASDDSTVLVPDALDREVEVTDVRDLVEWLTDCAERRDVGVFNAVGPLVTLGELIDTATAVAGFRGELVLAPERWLAEQGVQEWMGPRSLPLWLADPDWQGFTARDGSRARAAGLRHRPLEETLRDALAWEEQQPQHPHGAGLTDAEERELLAALRSPSDASTPRS